jgi:hypothetical protein
LEQVVFSRVENKEAFAVADNISLDMEILMKIGQGKAYEARPDFEDRIRQSADTRQSEMMPLVKAVDPSPEDTRTFDGGFAALVQWFREKLSSQSANY